MSDDEDSPVFIDTSAFVAAYIEDDAHHDAADSLFEAIREEGSSYGPVYATQHILCETEIVVSIRGDGSLAKTVVDEIGRSETINILPVSPATFTSARTEYVESEETGISLFDHLSGVIASENGIEHVFTFDGDFETLGFSVIPA